MQDMIINLVAFLKIRTKILIGVGMLLAMSAIVAGTSLLSLTTTKREIVNVVEERQPLTIASLQLSDALDRANASLGFYLSSVSDADKQAYDQSLQRLDTILSELHAMPAVQADAETLKLIDYIETQIAKYKGYRDRMISLAADFTSNYPAMRASGEKLNPLAMTIQANLQNMMSVERDESASPERRKFLYELASLRQNWMNVLIGFRAFMAFRDQVSIENMKIYREVFAQQMEKMKNFAGLYTFEQADAMDQIREALESYNNEITAVMQIHNGEQWRTDSYLIRTEIGPLVDDIKGKIDHLVQTQTKLTATISSNLVSDVSNTQGVVTVMTIASILFGLLGAWLGIVMITKPLNRAVEAMHDIAHGDGDLTQRLEVHGRDEIASLSRAFNTFIEKVQGIVTQVAGSTSQLAAAAEEMSLVVDGTKQGIQRQRQETDQVATAMNEMVATVQEVASNAVNASEMANAADRQAQTGRDIVNKTVSSIQALADEVEKASQAINGLEKDSEQIGSVLDVIQGIAEQTNLLALNAAIEAARAGDQGRGFAVVADEVRGLASRTQSSTQEIQAMIERLQNGARDAVAVMQTGTTQAHASVKQASEAGSSLMEITTAVGNISHMNSQIAHASQQQGTVAEEINQNIVNISSVAEESANGTEEMARSSIALAELAAELQGMVAQFKV